MKSGINKVILNGKITHPPKLKKVLSALHNETILTEKGGYIFKSLIKEDHLYLGILPYFINGERALHHDIDLPESKFTLIGFINSNCSLGLIFKLSKEEYLKGLSSEDIETFHKHYSRFACFLLEYDFPKSFGIDMITKQLLVEIGIFPEAPVNIGELAE